MICLISRDFGLGTKNCRLLAIIVPASGDRWGVNRWSEVWVSATGIYGSETPFVGRRGRAMATEFFRSMGWVERVT
ncbi:MAG: hypothetical protein CMJ77_14625 [Planctomycetaceae bacterium]|nr:hypothetical protein [Planctomycetaceae bacterium]